MGDLSKLGTVTVELSYDLWVLVHDPANAGEHRADPRIRKIVHDAIGVVEDAYAADHDEPGEGR